MKKIVLILAAAVVVTALYSCNDVMRKIYITDDIPDEELRGLYNSSKYEDSVIYMFYEEYADYKDGFFEDMEHRMKYGELTYRDISDAVIKLENSIQDVHDEWRQKYGKSHDKMDSIVNYWKEYYKNNNADSYIGVDFVEHVSRVDYIYAMIYAKKKELKNARILLSSKVSLDTAVTHKLPELFYENTDFSAEAHLDAIMASGVEYYYDGDITIEPKVEHINATRVHDALCRFFATNMLGDRWDNIYNLTFDVTELEAEGINIIDEDIIPKDISEYIEHGYKSDVEEVIIRKYVDGMYKSEKTCYEEYLSSPEMKDVALVREFISDYGEYCYDN